MALTIDPARIKEKCAVSGSGYDDAIDHLIAELSPVIEYRIRAECLDASEAGLLATLDLGATEIVCGEFLAQRLREEGALVEVEDAGVITRPYLYGSLRDPYELQAQGWERLGPYLKRSFGGSSAPGGDGGRLV